MPALADIDHLPYIRAMLTEILRWGPPIFSAVPHAAFEDQDFQGYRIPSQVALFMSMRQMTLDEDHFPDPQVFRPERWIENPKLPVSYFGFGRRICSGRHVALKSLYLAVARLLWGFDFGIPPSCSREDLLHLVAGRGKAATHCGQKDVK